MKPRALAGLAVVVILLMGGMPVFAQRPFPPHFEYFGELFAIPPIPPVPPIPPIPPLPPMPFEHFNFEFWQGAVGQSSDPEVRFQQEVFRSLLRNNADRAIEVATDRLKTNPGDPVVLASLSAIASSESSKAKPLLISIAKTSTNTAARREATNSIVRNREDKEALPILDDIYASNSDNVETRRAVVSSIGRLSDPRVVAVLARIIRSDTDESIRRSALRSLGNRQDSDSMKALEELLKQVPRTPGK